MALLFNGISNRDRLYSAQTMKSKSFIIVSDPDPAIEKNLIDILTGQDFMAVRANDGHELLDKVKTLEFDLVLAAGEMSGIDGYQVCRLLKESEKTRHIPVMLASAMTDQVTRNRAIQAGADEFITKPFNRIELLSRVVTLLRIKSLHDRLERQIKEKEEEKRKLAEKTAELKLLSEIARIVISIKDQKGVLSEIINNIREAFHVEASFLVTRSQSQWMLETASTNLSQTLVGQILKGTLSLFEYIERTEKPIILNEASGDIRIPEELAKLLKNEVQATLCSPIFIRGQLIGILQVVNKKDQAGFDTADMTLLMTVSGQIALAIENMQLFNKMANFNLTLQDEVKEATLALVELKNFNESILQNLSSGVITVDLAGNVLFVNRACKTILGISEVDMMERSLDKIVGVEAARHLMQPTLDVEQTPISAEAEINLKNRKKIYLGFTTTVRYMGDHQREGYIISFRDISQIREMQETILRMDRLASSGLLTSAIAHEIRNPLAGIKTMAQALEKELPIGDQRHEYVHRIIKQINRLNDLLKAFFTYAKPVRPDKKMCDLRMIFKEARELLKERCETDRIVIEENYDPFLNSLYVDENQIQQTVINLLINAMDAIGHDGKITINGLSGSRALTKFSAPTEVVEVKITDTGKGIAPEQLRSIFDPFFTTKSSGIGLGLSIVYRIVHEHGGDISVESVLNKGTTFTIIFPQAEQATSLVS